MYASHQTCCWCHLHAVIHAECCACCLRTVFSKPTVFFWYRASLSTIFACGYSHSLLVDVAMYFVSGWRLSVSKLMTSFSVVCSLVSRKTLVSTDGPIGNNNPVEISPRFFLHQKTHTQHTHPLCASLRVIRSRTYPGRWRWLLESLTWFAWSFVYV